MSTAPLYWRQMKQRTKFVRALIRLVFLPGVLAWGLVVRFALFLAKAGAGPSLQVRFFILMFKGARRWSRLQPMEVRAARAAEDSVGKRIRTARMVTFERVRLPRCEAEWVVPPRYDPGAAILYFHGGGYITGSLTTHRSVVSHIANSAKVRILNVAYRLAPEHPYPAAFEDARDAYGYLLSRGFEPRRIAVAGDSAGGGLATALLIALRDECARAGCPGSFPAGAALLSPWLDLADEEGSWERLAATDWLLTPEGLQKDARLYIAGTPAADPDPDTLRSPYVSPCFADLTGLPPLLIHAGSDELLRDNIRAFVEKARAAGVKVIFDEWPGMFHAWHVAAAYLPEGRRAVEEIGMFLRVALS